MYTSSKMRKVGQLLKPKAQDVHLQWSTQPGYKHAMHNITGCERSIMKLLFIKYFTACNVWVINPHTAKHLGKGITNLCLLYS